MTLEEALSTFSLMKLSKKTGIAATQLCGYRSRSITPTAKNIHRIAKALGCDVSITSDGQYKFMKATNEN